MSDVFRPLCVLVEAVEAEARRLLAQQPEQSPYRIPVPRTVPLPDVLDVMCRVFNEPTLSFQREAMSRDVRVGHRCRVCRKGHTTTIEEKAFESAESIASLLVERVQALLEAPCPDLGLRGVP